MILISRLIYYVHVNLKKPQLFCFGNNNDIKYKENVVCLLTKFIILELFDEVTPTFTLTKPENVIIQVVHVLVYIIKYTL